MIAIDKIDKSKRELRRDGELEDDRVRAVLERVGPVRVVDEVLLLRLEARAAADTAPRSARKRAFAEGL